MVFYHQVLDRLVTIISFEYKRTWKAQPFAIELIQKALHLGKSAVSCSSFHWNHFKDKKLASFRVPPKH